MNANTYRRYLWDHEGDPLRDAPPLDPNVAPRSAHAATSGCLCLLWSLCLL